VIRTRGCARGHRRLAGQSFGWIEERFVGDTLTMPASHFMMILEAPRVA
jgi:hypothetical protein